MAVVKRIVCLANSRKQSGRCVAGKELRGEGPGAWVRPVSDRPFEELLPRDRRCRDGSEPRLLDLIDVPLRAPRPRTYQCENWLLDRAHPWGRAGRLDWDDLAACADDPPTLWTNGSSSLHGLNDRVRLAEAQRQTCSLYLLYVPALRLYVFAPPRKDGKLIRRVQADFTHRRVPYRLWVTDPVVEERYLAGQDGEFRLGECFLTVSLGEPFEGYCYKLVAAIIPPA